MFSERLFLLEIVQLFLLYFIPSYSHSIDGFDDDGNDSCLCRRCGHEVVQSDAFTKVISKLALLHRNDTILGVPNVLIQLFKNPAGEQFEIITAKKADVYKAGKAYHDDSWFPGYSWTIGVCPTCGAHLGWYFTPSDEIDDDVSKKKDSFVGLVLNSLLSETYASTLTIVPRPKNERSY